MLIDALERELRAVDVPQDQWKRILLSKLTIKVAGLLSDLTDSDNYIYDDCKERLYDRMGISNTQAGIKIFEMWSKEFSETNQREGVTKLFSLCERYFNKCDSWLDFYVAIGKALIRRAIQPANQAILDARFIQNRKDLFDTVDTIQTLGRFKEAGLKRS